MRGRSGRHPTTSPGRLPRPRVRSPTRRSSCRSTGAARSCRSPSSTKRSIAWPTTKAVSGSWLATLPPGDVADLRGRAVEHVTKFLECFPPLDPRWRPVTEGAAQFPVAGPIVLRARIDLTLGVPRRDESRKVIVDLKTGRLLHRHREDLRFYALIETLVRDVPPRLLASYSLDSAAAETEEVTIDLLRSTLRRTLDGVERMIEIRFEGRPPTRTPGPACRWCALPQRVRRGSGLVGGRAPERLTARPVTPRRHDGGMPEQPQQRGVVAPPAATTVQFAAAARALAAAARRFGLAAPTFRTPPRLVGLDRTVRRHARGGVVSVRVRGRPWVAVLADMVDGVVAVNRLDARRANRARADLWDAVAAHAGVDPAGLPVSLPGSTARPPTRRVA